MEPEVLQARVSVWLGSKQLTTRVRPTSTAPSPSAEKSVSLATFSVIWLFPHESRPLLEEVVKPIAYWVRAPAALETAVFVAVRGLSGRLAPPVKGREVVGWVSEVVETSLV